MDNQENNTQNTNLNPAPSSPPQNKSVTPPSIHAIGKVFLWIFIVSIFFVGVLGVLNIWGSLGSSNVGSELDGTFGVIAGVSVAIAVVIRFVEGKNK